MEGPGGPDLVPTAPHWPAWVGLMVTTHFDLVLGPFWVPPGAQKGPILAQISMAPYLLWYCMVLHRLHSVVQLIWRAGELPRSASSHSKWSGKCGRRPQYPMLGIPPTKKMAEVILRTAGPQISILQLSEERGGHSLVKLYFVPAV